MAAVLTVGTEARAGGAFPAEFAPTPLDFALIRSAFCEPTISRNVIDDVLEDIWSDSRTRGSIAKTTRALKLHVLKQSAYSTCMFLGAGSKTMSMVFLLKKFPSSLKAMQISLPFPLAQSTEGLFVKTSTGKRVLSVQFGRGDMDEDALVKNAMATTRAVRKTLDTHLVREIIVDADRLKLPVWNRKLWDGRKQAISRKRARAAPMAPPAGFPSKRGRVS